MTVYVAYDFAGEKLKDGNLRLSACKDEVEATNLLKLWVNQLDLDESLGFAGIEIADLAEPLFEVFSEPSNEDILAWEKEIGLEADQLIVIPPGKHPGVRAWWLTTNATIFVAKIRK